LIYQDGVDGGFGTLEVRGGKNMANPIWNTRMYAKITGYAVAAVALLGIILNSMGSPNLLGENFLAFDWTHNIVHVVLAAIALYVGFAATDAMCTMYAKAFGVVYTLLGVTGFFVADLGILHLELGENLVHLVIGGWGVVAGFFGTKMATGTTTSPTPARK
jgi:hypothetical protein